MLLEGEQNILTNKILFQTKKLSSNKYFEHNYRTKKISNQFLNVYLLLQVSLEWRRRDIPVGDSCPGKPDVHVAPGSSRTSRALVNVFRASFTSVTLFSKDQVSRDKNSDFSIKPRCLVLRPG